MNRKSLLLVLLFLFGTLVWAIPFTPQGNIDMKNVYNITNLPRVDANTVNATTITGTFTGTVTGAVNWTSLQNYPSSCASNNAIKQIDDTLTCTPTINQSLYWDDYNTVSQLNDSHNHTDTTMESLSWIKLQNYPVSCPTGSYLTGLNDSVTCTSITTGNTTLEMRNAVNNTGGTFNMNINGTATNITGHIGDSLIDNLAWSKLTGLPWLYYGTGLSGENITSGTVADARIASTITRDSEVPSLETDAAHDTCQEITGCVLNAYNSTQSILTIVNTTSTYQFSTTGTAVATSDSTWTLHDSYPTACTGGQYVTAIGDTLTCGTPSDLNTGNSTLEMRNAVNVSGTYLFTSSGLSCTNCIGGTEIDETSFGAIIATSVQASTITASGTPGKVVANAIVAGYINASGSGLTGYSANYNVNSSEITGSDNTWTSHNSYPSACTGVQFVQGIGDTLSCATPTDTSNSSDQMISATASSYYNITNPRGFYNALSNLTGYNGNLNVNSSVSLSTNGANCDAGSYPLGVDASGAVESCTDATTEIVSVANSYGFYSALSNISGYNSNLNVNSSALNVLKAGDTMTGNLQVNAMINTTQNLSFIVGNGIILNNTQTKPTIYMNLSGCTIIQGRTTQGAFC